MTKKTTGRAARIEARTNKLIASLVELVCERCHETCGYAECEPGRAPAVHCSRDCLRAVARDELAGEGMDS